MADDLSRGNRFKQDCNMACLGKSGFVEIQRSEALVSSPGGHKNCVSDCVLGYVIYFQTA